MSTEERVRRLIAEQFTLKEVSLDARLGEDFNADSLEVVELILRFEEEFGVSIPEQAARSAETVGGLVKVIEDLIAKQSGGDAPCASALQ